MCYVLKGGTTSKVVFVEARDAARDRTPVIGLSHESPGASAAFIRAGASSVQRMSLAGGTLGRYQPGGFVEVDRSLMPGVYALCLPDSVLAPGADSVVVLLGFTGARVTPIEISLVAYDPQDEQRLGMSALGPEGRIAALRGAFPRLTANELVETRDTAGNT